jgi:hypothetical protein
MSYKYIIHLFLHCRYFLLGSNHTHPPIQSGKTLLSQWEYSFARAMGKHTWDFSLHIPHVNNSDVTLKYADYDDQFGL